jgi:hypothetical protein
MIRKITLVTCLALLFLGILCKSAKVQIVEASGILESGGWIKYEVKINPILEGEVTPTLFKIEFISIEGTNVTIQTTMYLSDGDEWNQITTIDIVSGPNAGLIIPSNSKIGDSVNIGGYGNISIEGETTVIYTGVNRITVFASYSNSSDYLNCFWDKQTGIILEQNITKNDSTTFFKVLDTNIWETRLDDYPPYQNVFYFVIILLVVLTPLILLRMRKKRPRRRTRKKPYALKERVRHIEDPNTSKEAF